MKIFFTLFTCFILIGGSIKADKRNVLFIGNSYISVNNLPVIVEGIATSMGDTLTYDSYTPGGKTAMGHWNDATTKAKIMQGGWDYVIIQCQSQEPSFSQSQVMNDTYPYLKSLDSLVKATNNCAEVLYYMTWGRKNGDAANCPFLPVLCTYDGMQQQLRNSYLLFAQDFNSSVAPVGVAWKKMRDTNPLVELYTADESHPSINGSFLAGCVFYTSLFNKSCATNQYLPAGVGNGDMVTMQSIASSTVLDSLENWQGNGAVPKASFTFTTLQNTATFTNTSLRYQNSSWDFGDGTPINNNQNPLHLFPTTTSGTYNVCLTVTSPCGKTDSTCQSVTVGPLGLNDLNVGQQLYFTNNVISWDSDLNLEQLKIYNSIGQQVQTIGINTFQNSFLLNLTPGFYVIQAKTKQEQVITRKVIITSF